MINLQPTNKPGTDKIIYVMQSDVDQNLFIYIGKTFTMKDGTWTYGKYEMGDVTPIQLKNDLAKNGWHEVSASKAPARVIDGELPDAEEKGEDANDATVNDPENPMADCATVKNIDCNKLADDLFDIANKFGDFIKNTQRAANDGETVKDDLIESSSEEALQKNIATEIEAGKDPKQAAAIAYSVQRENDAAGEWVRGPRGTFKVVEGTKEDLRKDGYGFHHDFDANGKHYSVMVKNDEAVAVVDSKISDGHGILSSGQEATLRKYCDKYEVDFNKAYQEIERQLKRYPGKKVDDLIEGLLDDMVTGIFDNKSILDSKEGVIRDADLKVGEVHHDRYGNKYTIKRVQYPGDSKRGNEQGIIDVYVEKKSGPSHNAFFEIDKFKRMIVDSRSVRDSLTVGGKYRWEKKFGNLPLELRNIDDYVLLAAGDKMASLKTEEFAKLLESGDVQSIGEGYLPEYSGIKTDYKVKVGDRMFIVRATSKEEARRKLIQSLDRKLK